MTLRLFDGWCHAWYPGEPRRMLESVYVSNIGVFTEFPGDFIPEGEELHDFLFRQFVANSNDSLDKLRALPINTLCGDWTINGRAHLVSNITAVRDQYLKYAAFYGLDWPQLKSLEMANAIIEKRQGPYMTPEAAERRERYAQRRAARRQAYKALSLED